MITELTEDDVVIRKDRGLRWALVGLPLVVAGIFYWFTTIDGPPPSDPRAEPSREIQTPYEIDTSYLASANLPPGVPTAPAQSSTLPPNMSQDSSDAAGTASPSPFDPDSINAYANQVRQHGARPAPELSGVTQSFTDKSSQDIPTFKVPTQVAEPQPQQVDSQASLANSLGFPEFRSQEQRDASSRPAANEPPVAHEAVHKRPGPPIQETATATTLQAPNAIRALTDRPLSKPLRAVVGTESESTEPTVAQAAPALHPPTKIPTPQLPGEQIHVDANDTLWTVAQRQYGNGEYYRALYEYNRESLPEDGQLTAGQVVVAPTVERLRESFGHLCPQPISRTLTDISLDEVAAEHVVEQGDTLFEIARTKLGDPRRWPQIYRLNRDTLGTKFHELPVGTKLKLPAIGPETAIIAERPR